MGWGGGVSPQPLHLREVCCSACSIISDVEFRFAAVCEKCGNGCLVTGLATEIRRLN